MRALDIIGEDLEFGLRIDLGLFCEEQGLVRLFGVGLLRVNGHDDLAVEDGACPAVQNPLVELVAVAVGLGMMNRRVVVDESCVVD